MFFSTWISELEWVGEDKILTIYYQENMGDIYWGFINGLTQTHLLWGHRPGDSEPEIWQHDLYSADLKPYNPDELQLFEEYIKASEKPE